MSELAAAKRAVEHFAFFVLLAILLVFCFDVLLVVLLALAGALHGYAGVIAGYDGLKDIISQDFVSGFRKNWSEVFVPLVLAITCAFACYDLWENVDKQNRFPFVRLCVWLLVIGLFVIDATIYTITDFGHYKLSAVVAVGLYVLMVRIKRRGDEGAAAVVVAWLYVLVDFVKKQIDKHKKQGES